MKILLISTSARGHAIADALKRSSHNPLIYSICPAPNPGIRALCEEQFVMDVLDTGAIVELAKKIAPDFAFIGPEDPIAAGTADRLAEIGIPSVAPKAALARVEASKQFTRDLMEKYEIPGNPKFRTFIRESFDTRHVTPSDLPEANRIEGSSNGATRDDIKRYIEDELDGEYVVKYDALKGGKGVKVGGEHLSNVDEGVAYAMECIEECGKVVIEEKFVGVEFSLIGFTSGKTVVECPAVQDHKRANEGDTGPNTGGMGSYSAADHSLPFLRTEDIAAAHVINEQVAAALMEECGEPYTGILYGGFIVTKNGIRVIEYNCRFGDPEVMNILPLLSSDFVDICLAIISGELSSNLVQFEKKATVCLYITPDCYPVSKDRKGESVVFPSNISENARIYLGDIAEKDGGLVLGGSRTAGVVGIGNTIEEARQVAVELCKQVEGPVRFRTDIGTEDLIGKRVELLKELRK